MLAGSLLAGLTCNRLGCRRQRAFDEQDLRALANMPSEVAIENGSKTRPMSWLLPRAAKTDPADYCQTWQILWSGARKRRFIRVANGRLLVASPHSCNHHSYSDALRPFCSLVSVEVKRSIYLTCSVGWSVVTWGIGYV